MTALPAGRRRRRYGAFRAAGRRGDRPAGAQGDRLLAAADAGGAAGSGAAGRAGVLALAQPEHQRAWRRAERLLANIGSLPPALARALERPSGSGRRAVLRGLALLLGGAPLVWWGWRAQVWRDGFGADYLTAVGERRDLVLGTAASSR